MWKTSNATLPSVLIVESGSGDVFIVENMKTEPQVEKILKSDSKIQRKSLRRKPNVKIELEEPAPTIIDENVKQDEEVIIEEYLDECFEDGTLPVTFVDSTYPPKTTTTSFTVVSKPLKVTEPEKTRSIPDAIRDHQYTTEPTFDGNYSSEDFDEPSDDEMLGETKKKIDKKDLGRIKKHKLRQLTGKPACKYCDTVFVSRESLKMHLCKYLCCDPKNFICRICNKELSKKTFSNHLHETLDCQYCGKKFVNPRNMKIHIKNIHSNEKFIPPNSPKREIFAMFENQDEKLLPVLDETTGIMVAPPARKRKKYPRKYGRFECDLCGRIFTTVRSLKVHMDLHTNTHRYVCQTCGEKYATHTGITKHACLNKKRRRPEVDFRVYDVRHCKFCGLSFETFEDNKAHSCEFLFAEDPKLYRCRFCFSDMSKNSYNKHMARHLDPDKEWICGFCNKKLSDENGLNIHLTTHTGDKPFKCPYESCGQSFINKQLLTRHSRFHGVEIPVYCCTICNKEVASKYHLKTHMKIHNNSVECQLCKMEFTSRDELKAHYQGSHLPFSCSYCDKSFTLPRYLKMHEKLHNPHEEKPHKCSFCIATKAFTKLSLLMNHIYKVHNDHWSDWKRDHPEVFR